MSSAGENFAVVVLLLGVLVAVFTYGYYSTHLSSAQRPVIENLQLRSTSVDITGLNRTGLSLNLDAVVYNPNGFGATLDSVSYSISANGHYFGSGQTARRYDLAPQSSQTLVFPVSIGWKSAFEAMGSYIVDWGHVAWEVNGTANINIGGLSLSAPFEFTTG